MQTLLLVVFLAIVAGVIGVMVATHEPTPVSPPPTPQTDLDAASKEPAGQLLFREGPDDIIVRLRTGSCRGGGTPTFGLSDDNGWSFRTIRVPQVDDGGGISAMSPNITTIVAMEARARRDFVLWGADSECRVHSYTTTDAGDTWRQGDEPITQWRIDPKTGVVFSPQGPANVTCDAIATLNGFNDATAVATCVDRSVHISEDGETWESAPDLGEATTAVFFTSTSRGFAVRDEAECRSRVYRTNNGGETWTEGGCVVEGVAIPAIGGSEDRLVAGGSAAVWVSTDGGESWRRPINPREDPEILGRKVTPAPTPEETPTDEEE